jgi:hypothetical protein
MGSDKYILSENGYEPEEIWRVKRHSGPRTKFNGSHLADAGSWMAPPGPPFGDP